MRRSRKAPADLGRRGEGLRPRSSVRAVGSLRSPLLQLPLPPFCVRKRPLKLLLGRAEDALEVVGELDVLGVEAQPLSHGEGVETPVRGDSRTELSQHTLCGETIPGWLVL